MSERERFSIEAFYYLYTTGELEKAAQVFELWQQTYPRDSVAYRNLGVISDRLGNLEKSVDEYREALRLDPNTIWNYGNLAAAYVNVNRLDEAEAVYKQAEQRKMQGYLRVLEYQLAFLKGDATQMAQLAAAAMGDPGAEDQMLGTQIDTAGWQGKMKDVDDLTRRAMDSAERNDAPETAANYQVSSALRAVEVGYRQKARTQAQAALKLASNSDVQGTAAMVLARSGDAAAAEKLAGELDKAFPQDTLVQKSYLPAIRAAVALERKDANRAIELLKLESAMERGAGAGIYPVYIRGEAYLMLHDGKAAAAEFQKFVERWGQVGNFPIGALARLGLARACAMQGDSVKAKNAYQNFFTLWKDADPDVPILKEAKAEYSKLR